jgi:hypothetical protein
VLTKQELLKMLIFFIRVSDEHMVWQDKTLTNELCVPDDRQTIGEITGLLKSVTNSFRYIDSPEFKNEVANKSAAYRSAKSKFAAEPVKKQRDRERLEKALENLLDSQEAFQLLPVNQHQTLKEIKALVFTLSNPDKTGQSPSDCEQIII